MRRAAAGGLRTSGVRIATSPARSSAIFRVDADRHDVGIRRLIAHYDATLATGVELLAALAPATAHVLELGARTGGLALPAIWIAVAPGDLPGLALPGSVEIGLM